MGATEDAAAHSVIASQKPACAAGWGTGLRRSTGRELQYFPK
jgi:hypothetical protein